MLQSEHVSGAENGAERPDNRVERSGARSGRSRSGNGDGSGGYRIRLERGAAFSPAPLRSHALASMSRVTTSPQKSREFE